MARLKRIVAGIIVCFKPHVFLTLCILLVIAQSILIAVRRGTSTGWRLGEQHDITLTMTTLILVVALVWAAFFIFIVRFELSNELESLLVLFQCSKRGLRFLGVIGFHVGFLLVVALIVSAAVERSIPMPTSTGGSYNNSLSPASWQTSQSSSDTYRLPAEKTKSVLYKLDASQTGCGSSEMSSTEKWNRANIVYRPNEPIKAKNDSRDRDYLLAIYKIWLTAIVYAFLYLIIENVIVFYADMSLVEFVHFSFLALVTKVTGIDLSDYPAGEMLFNPLVRHRIR